MKFGSIRSTAVAATVLVAALGINSTSIAGDDLAVQDAYVTTLIDKSVVSGTIRSCGTTTTETCYGPFELDAPLELGGNLLFDYTGDVYSVETDSDTAELKEMTNPVGTISGTAAFPMAFAMMAGQMKGVLDGQIDPSTLEIPPVIDWTCNACTMVVDGKTYTSVVDAPEYFMPGAVDAMRMKGRAFTGLGPVEMGEIVPGASLSVRMAGCSAVTGDGKVGTLCLNGTFTFDMSNLHLGQLTGTGTSNCITVLQPMMMP